METSTLEKPTKTLAELTSLRGKVAVITGGAQGIGYAIAQRFGEAGAEIVIGDINPEVGEQAVTRLAEKGVSATFTRLDATQYESQRELAEHATATYGQIDIWVNNAGIYRFQTLSDTTPESWQEMLDLDLSGTFYGAKVAAEFLQKNGGGVIINLSSTAGFSGNAATAHYTAVKFGVRGLTAALGKELSRSGIRVMALAPGMVNTPGTRTESWQSAFEKFAGMSMDGLAQAMVPLGRKAEPDDIAKVALFCATDLSGYLTGQTLLVDGGMLA
ncbi:SDR family NAD(P)-dependent oxidoreductase [Tunicatimonas pelagia]|uniref:SDR family NAD(P)-dependent oxidoreductase n=1 Tax=Tunicatimonas pelagia TaxID=931531 RepID=UPI00266568AC|nr:SDR family oxidoreductase [Tunicatimonas pelagia]WKN44825.1 SDR family oxidoreductase [Tunicatimonas pelagia]